MNIEITPGETSGIERAVKVSVPAEAVRAAEDSAARRYASSIRLPGFRPGKAPAAVVRKRFADAIRQETIESLVREAYKEVIEKDDVQVASQPHVHGLEFVEGKPLTFEFHFEVRPRLDLARTQGFRVERPSATVSDEQLEAQLERLREEKAIWTPFDGRPAEGDMVRVALSLADASGAMEQPREVPLLLGDGKAIPGIEELVMEATPGQTIERPVKWPSDFPDETQRDQTKTVRMTLNEVKRRSLPPLDDAFAREVGDFDSASALRASVREDMQRFAEREADAAVRQTLVDRVVEANPFDVPRSWVQQLVDSYRDAYQVPDSQKEAFDAEFRAVAERQVRRDLVIETLAEREGMVATERDLDDRIAEQAEQRGVSPGELYAALEKAGRLKELERSITEEKVFNWLAARNEISAAA